MDPYVRRANRRVYGNPWLAVEVHDIVHPTGVAGEHVLIVTPPAVAIVVEDGDDLIFARQARFGARSEVIELVKGGAEEGEDLLAAARRELREELGIEAASWTSLGEVYEIPSIVSQPVTLFVARDLTHAEADLEAVEQIRAERLSFREAVERARRGDLNDAVTLAALFRYSAMR
jgi:8-oxo-dGTP pyrophosphatase MutT (NUDIX family)